MWKRKTASVFLAAALLLPGCGGMPQASAAEPAVVLDSQRANNLASVQDAIRTSVKKPVTASAGGEWAGIGMSRSGANIPEELYNSYLSQL